MIFFLFVSNSHLTNYAYDNILYAFGYDLQEIKDISCFGFNVV